MWPPAGAPGIFFLSLMHPIGPELPISAHVACARVCRQLYVLRASHALVPATVGVGTVVIVYIGVAYTRGGGVVGVAVVTSGGSGQATAVVPLVAVIVSGRAVVAGTRGVESAAFDLCCVRSVGWGYAFR